jgi:hypothetical protein
VTGSDLQINHFWFTNELRMTNHLQMKKEEWYYNSASCCIQTLFTLNFTVFNATYCTSVLH